MQLNLVSKSKDFVWLIWAAEPGADGYLFYRDDVRVGRTFKAPAQPVKFYLPAGSTIRVEAVKFTEIAADSYPDSAPPPPPPPPAQYAPRTHNLGSHDQDPRFCMRPEYGVVDRGSDFIDQMGVRYSKEPTGLCLDGQRDRARIVPELRGADDMNGLEPCDQYVGPTGVLIGGSAGYPAGSYEK